MPNSMDISKQNIKTKLGELGYNRKVTQQDQNLVNKNGIGALKRTFGVNQGVSTNPGATDGMTPNQAGQDAVNNPVPPGAVPTLDQLRANENTAITQEKQLSDQGIVASQLIGKLLDVKRKGVPFDQKIAKIQERAGSRTFKSYVDQGMSFEQALASFKADQARADAQVNFYNTKKNELVTQKDKVMSDFTAYINAILQGTQYQITNINNQIGNAQTQAQNDYANKTTAEQNAISLAFNPATLVAGVMPPGLPPEYVASWEAASTEAKRQQKLAETPRGGGSAGDSTAELAAKLDAQIRGDVSTLIESLDSRKISWATAFDQMKTTYPSLSNDKINEKLGGNYDPTTGINTGRAQITQSIVADAQKNKSLNETDSGTPTTSTSVNANGDGIPD